MCQSGALSIAAKYFQLGADAFWTTWENTMIISQTLRRAVQQNPDGIATIYKDRKRSWRAFENRVARLAAGLRALGAERGNRVAIL